MMDFIKKLFKVGDIAQFVFLSCFVFVYCIWRILG